MKLAALLLFAVSTTACAKQLVVHRPADKSTDQAVTKLWTAEIARTARDGDWILSRSYATVGTVIVAATRGEDFSHASIYDAKKGTVIESVGSGVREITLEQLVMRNHYLVVVRPAKMTPADQTFAVDRARTKVGLPFDVRGGIGFDNPNAWYCSELVYWASQTAARNGSNEHVVTPADLMKYGEVIYWSGNRDDAQVMELAMDRAAHPTPPARKAPTTTVAAAE